MGLAPVTRVMLKQEIILPLRGLASEGAEPLIRSAMASCRGVLGVAIHEPEFVVHIAFDPTVTSGEEVRLHFHRAFHAPRPPAAG